MLNVRERKTDIDTSECDKIDAIYIRMKLNKFSVEPIVSVSLAFSHPLNVKL